MDEMHVLWNGTEARDRGSDIVKAQPEYTAREYRWERNAIELLCTPLRPAKFKYVAELSPRPGRYTLHEYIPVSKGLKFIYHELSMY